MISSNFIDAIPLWLLYLLTAAIVLISIEVGWRLGKYRSEHDSIEKVAPIGAAVGATLGLLAFLLAFTFGLAASRFDNRKQIVLQEANAIGTTFLRADFLPAEAQEDTRNLLRQYAALRLGGARVVLSQEGMASAAALQDQLWAIAADAGTTVDSFATGLFIQSLNEMIDIDAALCHAAGMAIISTSANRSTETPARTDREVQRRFGKLVDYILPAISAAHRHRRRSVMA